MTKTSYTIQMTEAQLRIIHAALLEHRDTNRDQCLYNDELTEELEALVEMSNIEGEQGIRPETNVLNGWAL